MADLTLADVMALENRDDRDGLFGGGYAWIILIFLFFLAFGGGFGGFGGNGNAQFQTQRDVLETSCQTQRDALSIANQSQRDMLECCCTTQKAVQDVNYQTLLGFKDQAAQMAACCLTKTKNFVMKIKEFFAGSHNSNVMQVAYT